MPHRRASPNVKNNPNQPPTLNGGPVAGPPANQRPEIETLVRAAGAGLPQLAGHDVEQGAGRLQLAADHPRNDPRQRHHWVRGGHDVVGRVLGDIRLVQLVDPVGLVVDERVYFLWGLKRFEMGLVRG